MWREYTDQVTQLRDQLSAVDPTDRATWARVARETSGAFAAWSQRVEATPGPLADASRTLARTAQISARDVRPKNTTGPRSIAGAANLLATASACSSATHARHGNADPTRTPTGSYANTFRNRPTCPGSRRLVAFAHENGLVR